MFLRRSDLDMVKYEFEYDDERKNLTLDMTKYEFEYDNERKT
jgi:hypothetical protein